MLIRQVIFKIECPGNRNRVSLFSFSLKNLRFIRYCTLINPFSASESAYYITVLILSWNYFSYILFSHTGHGSISTTLSAELFEGPTRAIGVSIYIFISAAFVFIISKYFVYVITLIGNATTYWLFSGNCILTALFIAFCIPETKGKSFEKIQEALGAKKVVM